MRMANLSSLGFRKLPQVSAGVRKWTSQFRNEAKPTLALGERQRSQGPGQIEHCLQGARAPLKDSYHGVDD